MPDNQNHKPSWHSSKYWTRHPELRQAAQPTEEVPTLRLQDKVMGLWAAFAQQHPDLARRITNFGWTAAVTASFVAEQAGEYGIAIGFACLALLLLVWAILHWKGIDQRPTPTMVVRVSLVMVSIVILVVSLAWIVGNKGDQPWSRIPQGWESLKVLARGAAPSTPAKNDRTASVATTTPRAVTSTETADNSARKQHPQTVKPKPRKRHKEPIQQAAEREPLEPYRFAYDNQFKNNTSTLLPPPRSEPTPPEINLGGHHNRAKNNLMETGKINFPNGSHDNLASGNTLVRWTWTRYIADLEETLVHPKPNMPAMPGPADDMEMLRWDLNRDYWLWLPADERDKKGAIFNDVIKRVRAAGNDQTKLLEVLEDLKKNPPQCLPPNWH